MSKGRNVTYIYDIYKYDKDLIVKSISDSKVLDNVLPTDKVVLKPNFVQESRNQDSDWEYVITHPIVISAVIELLCNILSIKGKIILADAPMTGSSFSKILDHMPVDEWKKCCFEKNIPFEIIDLRDEEWEMADNGIILNRKQLPGDPRGKVVCNLKKDNSEFFNKPETTQLLYGADYDTKETNNAHNGTDNLYSVSKTVIDADIIINLAKLKTHRKAGITCCLKNLVGINTNKNFLPHHTIGTPKDGGDQFESSSSSTNIESKVTMIAKNIVVKAKWMSPLLVPLKKLAVFVWGDNKTKPRSGGWYGNDTLWRTILDLNKVMFYSDIDGNLKDNCIENRKKYIGIVDGIFAGQGDGPLNPDIYKAGVLLCGTNPVEIDSVAAKCMGFDYTKIPQIKNAFDIKNYKIANGQYKDIICEYKNEKILLEKLEFEKIKQRKAPIGWIGHIERTDREYK